MTSHRFAVVRLGRLSQHFEFPIHHDSIQRCPLGGCFDDATMIAFEHALADFPGARPHPLKSHLWLISNSREGQIDVQLTSDGCVFLQATGAARLVFALFVHLQSVNADISLEHPEDGTLHNRASLSEWVIEDEERDLPFDRSVPLHAS